MSMTDKPIAVTDCQSHPYNHFTELPFVQWVRVTQQTLDGYDLHWWVVPQDADENTAAKYVLALERFARRHADDCAQACLDMVLKDMPAVGGPCELAFLDECKTGGWTVDDGDNSTSGYAYHDEFGQYHITHAHVTIYPDISGGWEIDIVTPDGMSFGFDNCRRPKPATQYKQHADSDLPF
jgi:hypothetical protein